MSAQVIVYTLLSQASGLTALVDARIYPDVMPDAPTLPAVTFQKTGGSSDVGAESNPSTAKANIQVTVWAKSRLDTTALTKQVRLALERKRNITVASVPLNDIFCDSDIDDYDHDTKVYFTHIDFRVFFKDI